MLVAKATVLLAPQVEVRHVRSNKLICSLDKVSTASLSEA